MQKISLNDKSILVTGSAGFIGACLVERLLSSDLNAKIVGIDNKNDYYDSSLKDYRLTQLHKHAKNSTSEFIFCEGTIVDKSLIDSLFAEYKFGLTEKHVSVPKL